MKDFLFESFTQEKHFSLADWSEVSKNEDRCCSSCKFYQATTVPELTLLYFICCSVFFFCFFLEFVLSESEYPRTQTCRLPPSKVCLWMSDCNSVFNRLTPLPPRLQEKRRQTVDRFFLSLLSHHTSFKLLKEVYLYIQAKLKPKFLVLPRLFARRDLNWEQAYHWAARTFIYTQTRQNIYIQKMRNNRPSSVFFSPLYPPFIPLQSPSPARRHRRDDKMAVGILR